MVSADTLAIIGVLFAVLLLIAVDLEAMRRK
jgi:hypothetical protein